MIARLTLVAPVPLGPEPGTGWQAQGACLDHPEVDFFPARGQSAGPAKLVCADCPVKAECLAHALGDNPLGIVEKIGVWGGTSERERRKLRKARRVS